MKFNYKISSKAAFISAIIIFPFSILSILEYFLQSNKLFFHLNNILILVIAILGVLIFFGYYNLAKRLDLPFLTYMSITVLIFEFSPLILRLFSPFLENSLFGLLSVILSIIVGIIFILFGCAIYKLKNKFGDMIIKLRILYIIMGAFIVTILLGLLYPFLMFVILLFEKKLFKEAAKKYS